MAINSNSLVIKACTDSGMPKNVSDVGLLINSYSKHLSDNSSDSDSDPFEDIKVTSKNINFSRSRSYFGDDFLMYPLTPRLKYKLDSVQKENQQMRITHPSFRPIKNVQRSPLTPIIKRKLESNTNENQSMIITPPSFFEEVNKGLALRKNSPKAVPKVKSSTKNLGANELPVITNSKPTQSPSTFHLARKRLSSPLTTNNVYKQITDSRSDTTFNIDISSNVGATSTPTDSSCDLSKNISNDLNCERLSSPFNVNLCQNPYTPTNKVTTPEIASMKRYSLRKAAISAKKKFEAIVRNAMLQKSEEKYGQNTTSEASMNNKQINVIQSHSLLTYMNTPLRSLTVAEEASLINKTPVTREVGLNNSSILTGIRELNTTPNKKINNHNLQNTRNSEDFDDDDLPPTQPLSSILLRGIVAYVEIKSGKEYRCEGTKAELESLGAKVENNFTKKVTHCFFHWGKMSTYRRAIEWKVPLVSTLWIEACKAELQMLPIDGFEPYGLEKYKEELPLYKLKTKIQRPVTESKLPTKTWKRINLKDKATQAADAMCRPPQASNVESDNLVEALHSVAGDIKKVSHQMEQILTSPLLQKTNKQQNGCVGNPTQGKSIGENSRNSKRRNKKLIFGCLNEDEQRKGSDCNNYDTRLNNDLNNEIRVSYDSDDLLFYAKKQAANARCSAPPRLLTSKKCKKLLTSCSKQPNPSENKNDSAVTKISKPTEHAHNTSSVTTRRQSRHQQFVTQQQSEIIRKSQKGEITENKQKPRKRKLLLPSQTIAGFKQDSRESTPDLSQECPYENTANKKQKTVASSKTKVARPLPPLIVSDWESDDSLTRAARRGSSALFVKKQKKVNPQRSIPTIVCTSLHRSDVEVVASIVSSLGKFTVEGAVSEQTTHVVTSSPRRTINLLKGIARGCWILNINWIYKSLESGKWLHEERFELLEFSPTVRQARVERQAFGPEFNLELFNDLGPIYVCRATLPPANDLTELIRLCGGTVVSNARVAKIIIGKSLPFSPNGHHPLMVKEKWVLDSISQLRQLNPHNYVSIVPEP